MILGWALIKTKLQLWPLNIRRSYCNIGIQQILLFSYSNVLNEKLISKRLISFSTLSDDILQSLVALLMRYEKSLNAFLIGQSRTIVWMPNLQLKSWTDSFPFKCIIISCWLSMCGLIKSNNKSNLTCLNKMLSMNTNMTHPIIMIHPRCHSYIT